MNVESTPAPSRAPGRSMPAVMPAGPLSVTVQNRNVGDQGNAMLTGPKTPPANRLSALNPIAGLALPQPVFSRLAMESSDEIAEIEIPLATISRKREAVEANQKAAESAITSKPQPKRLVGPCSPMLSSRYVDA